MRFPVSLDVRPSSTTQKEAFRPPPLSHTIQKKRPWPSFPWTCLQFISVDVTGQPGLLEQRRCHHQPIPSQGVRAEKGRKGGWKKGPVSAKPQPPATYSHEFMSHMKKLDRRARMWAFRGRVTGLPRLTWWLLLITSCHTEKNPLTAPDRPHPSPPVCANPQDSPHQEGPSRAPWPRAMTPAGLPTVTQTLMHLVWMLMEVSLCKAGMGVWELLCLPVSLAMTLLKTPSPLSV